MNNTKIRSTLTFFALASVLALAAFFRLYQLGAPAFRADTMLFFDMCRRPVNAWTIFTRWMDLLGHTSQLPFSMAVTKLFIDLFGLEPTAFVIRLPNAVFGILTVLGMYMLGRQMAGRAFGLVLALWMAVNPFHIQMNREAYFYSATVLGVTLQAWACVWAFRRRRRAGRFPVWFYLLALLGFFLMTYSHVTGWWVAALLVPFLGWILASRAWRDPRARLEFWCWLGASFLIGLPLLLMNWALPFFLRDHLDPEEQERVKRIFAEDPKPLLSFLWGSMQSAAWGRTALRSGLLILTCATTIAGLLLNRARFLKTWLLTIFLAGGFLIYYLAFVVAGTYLGQRHLAFLLPLYIAVLASGAWHVSALRGARSLFKSRVWRRAPAYGLAAIAVAVSIQPAWLSTQLTGKPIPYKEIARWCDTHLPAGSLVLVDRWFDPWNELRVHNATNIYFTFSIPNEPVDVYLEQGWRDTAKAFIDKYPDTAFFERKSYYHRPQVGPWAWPSNHFAHEVTFPNKAGIGLRDIGVAYRDSFYVDVPGGLELSLFYNTIDDIVAAARAQDKVSLVMFGPKWGYLKPWQPMQNWPDGLQQAVWLQAGAFKETGSCFSDLSELNRLDRERAVRYLNRGRWADYRTPSSESYLRVFNLTDQDLRADLRVVAIALSGPVRARVGDGIIEFPATLMSERRVPVILRPGEQAVRFSIQPGHFLLVLSAEFTNIDRPL